MKPFSHRNLYSPSKPTNERVHVPPHLRPEKEEANLLSLETTAALKGAKEGGELVERPKSEVLHRGKIRENIRSGVRLITPL